MATVNKLLLAKNIKRLRLKHKYTQKRFAEKIGVLPDTVARWENYKASPNNASVIKICKAFGYDISVLTNDLLYRDEEVKNIRTNKSPKNDPNNFDDIKEILEQIEADKLEMRIYRDKRIREKIYLYYYDKLLRKRAAKEWRELLKSIESASVFEDEIIQAKRERRLRLSYE